MRGKRSKQYRKLMQAYSLTFGFRPPYQVLVDAEIIQDTGRFKMDLIGGLERSLGEQVKPMITQCSIRHLYALKETPQNEKDNLISVAKNMERRRCNHHTLDEPLSALQCLQSVIDPKNSLTNKNRYIVASQDEAVRRFCRNVKGVPLVYVRRSVMIMEPMAESTIGVREGLERSKFRSGLRGRGVGLTGKRKREDEESDLEGRRVRETEISGEVDHKAEKRRKSRGPKGPNPLAVKKPKKSPVVAMNAQTDGQILENITTRSEDETNIEQSSNEVDVRDSAHDKAENVPGKKKRKRKHKSKEIERLIATLHSENEAG